MKIRLAVVDDHNLYKKGLVKLLEAFEEVSVIDEYNDGEEFINHFNTTNKRDPHIVLLDYQMPKVDGVGVCIWLKINRPNVKAIIISQYDDHYTVKKFINKGAVGYLLKATTIEELHEAIIQVYTNNFYFNSHFSNKMIIDLVQKESIVPHFNDDDELTIREKEVAKLICQELSYKEIATNLEISTRTVETHKNNILEKIGATKVTGIVVYATKKGWI